MCLRFTVAVTDVELAIGRMTSLSGVTGSVRLDEWSMSGQNQDTPRMRFPTSLPARFKRRSFETAHERAETCTGSRLGATEHNAGAGDPGQTFKTLSYCEDRLSNGSRMMSAE